MTSVAVAISAESVRAELDCILSDPLFHNSRRCSSLLKFIVERTLQGQHHSLKERIIGIEVFERSPEYDPGLDAIVRVGATEVRKRLALYYKEPAHNREIRIELPLRAYVAEFKALADHPAPEDASPSPAEATPALQAQPSGATPRLFGWIALAAVVLVVVAAGILRLGTTPPAIDQFWAPLLDHPEPIGVMVSALDESEIQIDFRKRDLSAATALISFIGTRNKASVLLYSSNTGADDLARQAIVFVGGGQTNELAGRLGKDLRYQFRDESTIRWIEDSTRPTQREWRTDLARPYEERKDYALITRALDGSTGQWWIGISGLSAFGTLLAQELVVDTDAMNALNLQLPEDWSQKNFQVVLELDVVNRVPGAARVIATHSW